MHHRQAEAGTSAPILGREKRLGGAPERRLVHAATRILHTDADILARSEPCYLTRFDQTETRCDDQIDRMPTRRHGIPGVYGKVAQCELELVAVNPNLRKVSFKIGNEPDCRSERASQHLSHAIDD